MLGTLMVLNYLSSMHLAIALKVFSTERNVVVDLKNKSLKNNAF